MVSGLKNNIPELEKIEQKQERIETYKNAGIVLDAVNHIDNQVTQEILVVSGSNHNYADKPDLNQVSDEDIATYQAQLLESIHTYEVKQNEIVKTDNGNVFIHLTSTVNDKENTMDMSMYYTIMNGRFLTISFRYYNQSEPIANEQEQQTVQGIQFYEIPRPSFLTSNEVRSLAMGIMVVLFIIIGIVVFFIRRKDKKLWNNSIKDVKLKQYSKFGGLVLFFWTLCFYQVFIAVIDLGNASQIENMAFYTNCVRIQSTFLALIAMYQIYMTVKRKDTTPRKIIKSNLFMAVAGVVTTLARIIYAKIVPLEIYTAEYFEQELSTLLFSILYPLIWMLYFTVSKRVQVYYYLPNKSYKEIIKENKIYKWIKRRKTNY